MLVPENSLITPDPEAGRELAIKIARLTVKAMQPDDEVRARLRPDYAENADSLTVAAHVVAVEFATIAAANNYWR
ncbi:MAG: hexameric tyrosine-coordinated heme protein [Dehalococcoidia bacterium]|nr:hexameric tyrosine-coordinated heme protein [Dehalococcoidia bacterium]